MIASALRHRVCNSQWESKMDLMGWGVADLEHDTVCFDLDFRV